MCPRASASLIGECQKVQQQFAATNQQIITANQLVTPVHNHQTLFHMDQALRISSIF